MLDETTNPQPSDPPVGGTGSGGGTAPNRPDVEPPPEEAQMSEPPTGGSGSGT